MYTIKKRTFLENIFSIWSILHFLNKYKDFILKLKENKQQITYLII